MHTLRSIQRALVPLRPASRTVRLRLTLIYGALFLAGGAGLLAITYALVAHFSHPYSVIDLRRSPTIPGSGARHIYRGSGPIPPGANKLLTPSQVHHVQQLREQASAQRAADLHHLLVGSGLALAVMAVIAVAVGWVVAGRVLRPLRTMTVATQQISASNLHDRLALPGPKDELRALADTIDGLLSRLERAFDSQRRFVANAAHELRTPLTLERTLLDVALAERNPNVGSLREACKRAVVAIDGHEHLIESLLTLATSERGLKTAEPVDLSVVTAAVLRSPHLDLDAKDLEVTTTLDRARTAGDARLVERLVANLIDNAVRYNHRHGSIHVATGTTTDGAFVSVSNTGPVIPPEEIDRLLKPFQRLGAGAGGSVGLGLSIVAAIADAHRACLTARPRSGGGLDIGITFPARGPNADEYATRAHALYGGDPSGPDESLATAR
ncbi:MAG: HAMP domain-containing histidine kinase [Acidimicrobiaceae bacterium]|nr:HAMP domain-containing histidine kinase [Acidimicrobiaceae bacterium]